MRNCRCNTCGLYFPVKPSDVIKAFPHALLVQPSKQRPTFFTRRWLLKLVQKFYETLNSCAVKRHLFDYYLANVEALTTTERGLWITTSVPKLCSIRYLLLVALQSYLPQLVRDLERVAHVYAGSGVRGDGHYKLATRIIPPDEDTRITCIYAWISVDGSLLRPAAALPDEKMTTLLNNLDPLADDMSLGGRCMFVHLLVGGWLVDWWAMSAGG
jgi:hypothetical protein